MKKSMLGIVIAAFLVFGIAGQAAAYYDLGSLVLSLYAEPNGDKTDNEVGVHLLDAGAVPTTTITAITPIDLSRLDCPPAAVCSGDFTTTSDWADINVGVWGANGQTGDKWVATANMPTDGDYDVASATQILQTAAQTGMVAYAPADAADGTTDGRAVISTANLNSYDVLFNSNSAVAGSQAGFNADVAGQLGEVALADLDTVGYVDMYLWYSNDSAAFHTIDDPIGIIRLGLNASDCLYAELRPVPLPGAVVLLGSGLLGLVGIRRRSATA